MGNKTINKNMILYLSLILVLVTLIAVGIGRYYVSPYTVLKMFLSKIFPMAKDWTDQAESVIFTLRLPRIIIGVFVGSALSASGAVYQGTFNNPLVAPDMLGVSSGACVGASVVILLGFGGGFIQLGAFVGGIITVFLATRIPKILKNNTMLMLVLAGIILSGFMNSILGLLKYIADTETQLPTIVYWQLGSLAKSNYKDIYYTILPMMGGLSIVMFVRWKINILSLGDKEARTLGLNVKLVRGILIVSATLLTASSVSVAGTIGWIGLIIPHFGRMLVGNDNNQLIPFSILMGGTFLIIVDTIARVVTTAELPLSIITGIIGAPFYFYLLMKKRVKSV